MDHYAFRILSLKSLHIEFGWSPEVQQVRGGDLFVWDYS